MFWSAGCFLLRASLLHFQGTKTYGSRKMVARHKVGIFFSSLVSDNAANFLAFFNSPATIADLNCEGVVVHEAGNGDRKLNHLFRSFFMTIGAPQQLSVLSTKIRT
jgi:hypothetical protein